MSAAVADPALDDPQTQFRDSDRWEDAALAEPAVPAGQPQDIPAATVPDSDRTGARGSSGRPPMGALLPVLPALKPLPPVKLEGEAELVNACFDPVGMRAQGMVCSLLLDSKVRLRLEN